MSVYLDPLFGARARGSAARLSARVGHRWCHMVADTIDELHAMATRIGMKRAWFQGDHYDLVPSRREAAIRAGALALDRRAFVSKLREIRRVRAGDGGA